RWATAHLLGYGVIVLPLGERPRERSQLLLRGEVSAVPRAVELLRNRREWRRVEVVSGGRGELEGRLARAPLEPAVRAIAHHPCEQPVGAMALQPAAVLPSRHPT